MELKILFLYFSVAALMTDFQFEISWNDWESVVQSRNVDGAEVYSKNSGKFDKLMSAKFNEVNKGCVLPAKSRTHFLKPKQVVSARKRKVPPNFVRHYPSCNRKGCGAHYSFTIKSKPKRGSNIVVKVR